MPSALVEQKCNELVLFRFLFGRGSLTVIFSPCGVLGARNVFRSTTNNNNTRVSIIE